MTTSITCMLSSNHHSVVDVKSRSSIMPSLPLPLQPFVRVRHPCSKQQLLISHVLVCRVKTTHLVLASLLGSRRTLLKPVLPLPRILRLTRLLSTLLGPSVQVGGELVARRQGGAGIVPSVLKAGEEGLGVGGAAVLFPVLFVRGCPQFSSRQNQDTRRT